VPDAPRDTDAWMATVRDPAEQATEGKRRIDAGGAHAHYEIAPLPSGKWAVKVHCDLEFVTGMSIPWREFETREECESFFVEQARAFFEREKGLKKARAEYRKRMLALLETGLFGFVEPEPEGDNRG
jgi:hypothetical protein